jgi:hypothetical protein
MRELAALDESRPFRAKADRFTHALLGLIERRTARYGAVLRDRLPGFDRRYAVLRERLETLDYMPDTVIHGDLFGATTDGSDGHFAWCIAQLQRSDVNEALGL